MARQVVVQISCDVCESSDSATALEFSVGRSAFDIDLCVEHRAAFTTAMAPFVSRARTARARASTPTSAASAARGTVRRDPSQTAAMRRWAKDNGYAISGRGRIPGNVEAAYNAQHTK